MSTDWGLGLHSVFSDLFGRRSLVLLVLCWLGGALVLIAYGTLSADWAGSRGLSVAAAPPAGGQQTGSFVAWQKDPQAPGRAAYRVTFDNLSVENGSLGPFKTASHKVVNIDNLDVTFLRPPAREEPESEQPVRLGDFADLFAPPRRDGGAGAMLGLFERLQGEAADWTISMDLTNTTQVRIRRLDWRVCREDQTVFHVRCGQALLSSGASQVLLRGHATVAAAGATLESNCIRMDARHESFVVEGRYLLTRDGRAQAGAGACFDTELRLSGTGS